MYIRDYTGTRTRMQCERVVVNILVYAEQIDRRMPYASMSCNIVCSAYSIYECCIGTSLYTYKVRYTIAQKKELKGAKP